MEATEATEAETREASARGAGSNCVMHAYYLELVTMDLTLTSRTILIASTTFERATFLVSKLSLLVVLTHLIFTIIV